MLCVVSAFYNACIRGVCVSVLCVSVCVHRVSVLCQYVYSVLHYYVVICILGYFLFQLVVHNRSTKGCGMCCHVCGKVYKTDLLLLIAKIAYVAKEEL